MTKEELIQLLITLKMQSRYSENGTFVEDIKPSSFVFVINSAIEALEDTVSRQAVLDMIDNSLKIIDEYKAESEGKQWQ